MIVYTELEIEKVETDNEIVFSLNCIKRVEDFLQKESNEWCDRESTHCNCFSGGVALQESHVKTLSHIN